MKNSPSKSNPALSTGAISFVAVGLAVALSYSHFSSASGLTRPATSTLKLPPKAAPGYTNPGYGKPGSIPGYTLPGYGSNNVPYPGYYFPGYTAKKPAPFALSGKGLQAGDAATCQLNGWVISALKQSVQNLVPGTIIKGDGPALYYAGSDGKRHTFPNQDIFESWKPRSAGKTDCPTIYQLTNAELAGIPIGNNVTYKPGTRLVKLKSDPKVFAVSAGGTLRLVANTTIAARLYGGNWQKTVLRDIPDAFFINYTMGMPINTTSDFNVKQTVAGITSIDQDLGLK